MVRRSRARLPTFFRLHHRLSAQFLIGLQANCTLTKIIKPIESAGTDCAAPAQNALLHPLAAFGDLESVHDATFDFIAPAAPDDADERAANITAACSASRSAGFRTVITVAVR